jgi:hypothetical protein
VINGKGGCGKDTLINQAKQAFKVWNISSIDPVKDIARQLGYKEENKDDKSRKFLSDLKKLIVEWNDTPLRYCIDQTKSFIYSTIGSLLFVHIREPEEIQKYVKAVKAIINELEEVEDIDKNSVKVHTLLVMRPLTDTKTYGNPSDDGVEEFKYDFVFNNNETNELIARYSFVIFLEQNIVNPYIYQKQKENREGKL